MSETLRGIITDCVAVVSVLFVLGATFFVYELGLRHVHQELYELRTELSFVKQRNLELEEKIRFLEEGDVREEKFALALQKESEIDQPKIPSAKYELQKEVLTLSESGSCKSNVARDLFDGVCFCEEIQQIKRSKTRRKSGVKYKRKSNFKSCRIKRNFPRQRMLGRKTSTKKGMLEFSSSRKLNSGLTNFEVFCKAVATCIAKQNVKAKRIAKWPKAVATATCKAASRLKQSKAFKATNLKSDTKCKSKRDSKRKTSAKHARGCNSIIKDFTLTISKFKPSTKVNAKPKFASNGKATSKSRAKSKATSNPIRKGKATSKPKRKGKAKVTSKPETKLKTYHTKIKATSKPDKKVKTSPKQTTNSKSAFKTRGTAKTSPKQTSNPKPASN